MQDKSIFLDGARFKTTELFLEYNPKEAIYNLSEFDKADTKSLKMLYLSEMDIHEYMFAEKYFYNHTQWLEILKHKEIKKEVELWRTELSKKMESFALQSIREMSLRQDSTGFQAAKFIASRGWEQQKGRPSKEDINKRLNEQEHLTKIVLDGQKRLENHKK